MDPCPPEMSNPLEPPDPGEVARTWVGNDPVAVWNIDAVMYAVSDICPHRGFALSEGGVERTGPEGHPCLVCPGHAWRFDALTGQSLASPERLEVFDIEQSGAQPESLVVVRRTEG